MNFYIENIDFIYIDFYRFYMYVKFFVLFVVKVG